MSDLSSEELNPTTDEEYIITYPEDFSENDSSGALNDTRIEETNGVEEVEEHCEDVVNGVWSPTPQRRNLRLNLSGVKDQTEEASLPKNCQNPPSSVSTDNEKQASPAVWQPFGELAETPHYRSFKIESSVRHTQESSAISPTSQKTEEEPAPEAKKDDLTLSETMRTETTTTNSTIVNQMTESTTTNTNASSIRHVRSSNFPVSQSPTVTLLQKAREGQIPKGAIYINDRSESKGPLLPKNAVLIDQKVTVEGDKVHMDNYYAVPTLLSGEVTTQIIKAPGKYDGIGPTEYGIPVGLRTGVKDEYASDWYKTMYRSLHKGHPDSRGHIQGVHLGGYMSEPEYEKKTASLDTRRRVQYSTPIEHRQKKTEKTTISREISSPKPTESQKSVTEEYIFEVSPKTKEELYRNQPRSIADYEPGNSSLADKEFQKFWDDFWESLDDLHEHFRHSPRPQRSTEKRWPNALLCDGYESDSTLIHKSVRPAPQLDPEQQKAWYKEIQKGGEIPFTGLRKLAPEKPKESPHQYQETEVNIHYKSPIRNLEKEYIEEEELRQRQEETMRRFYAEERLKKQQQQMAEIEMRRHCDNFIPSQKSPIPLDRYDNPFDIHSAYRLSPDHQRTLARVLYPFVAQSTRELSLNKDDIVYINRQIDKNWYEGEHHSFVGIFPISYVTIIPSERANFYPKEVNEGYGRVKFNFRAKSPIELSLFKGERVILIRRVDQNWFEGRLGNKKGIFPASYIEVIQPVSASGSLGAKTSTISPKPVSPVSPLLSNGSLQQHSRSILTTKTYLDKSVLGSRTKSMTQSLHVDTYNEPIPYRSLYTYHPQNEDELELREGDTVYVMEKCDDGWYVGTSLRTGMFGTFPGNYVERI